MPVHPHSRRTRRQHKTSTMSPNNCSSNHLHDHLNCWPLYLQAASLLAVRPRSSRTEKILSEPDNSPSAPCTDRSAVPAECALFRCSSPPSASTLRPSDPCLRLWGRSLLAILPAVGYSRHL